MVDYMVEDAGNGTMSTSYNATKSGTGPDLLKPLTKPFTNLIVQVDKEVLIGWSFNVSSEFLNRDLHLTFEGSNSLRHYCKSKVLHRTFSKSNFTKRPFRGLLFLKLLFNFEMGVSFQSWYLTSDSTGE